MSTGYDFSQLYPASTVHYSPGSTFLATAVENRVIVRSSATLAIVRTWLCTETASAPVPTSSRAFSPLPSLSSSSTTSSPSSSSGARRVPDATPNDVTIDHLAWSPDGLYVLAFSTKAAIAWVFGLAHEAPSDPASGGGEVARVAAEGSEGLTRVEWGPHGSEVLAWSDFDIRLSVYDLSSGRVSRIQNARSDPDCHTSSPDGRYLAVLERHAGKEHVGIYDSLDSYALIRNFPLHTTEAQGIKWSPCGKWIAAWDLALSYSVHIYSPIGSRLGTFSSSSPTFAPASATEPEDPGLGVRTIAWAPGGRWLAIGGWDEKVRILESEGWRCVAVIAMGNRTMEKNPAVWKEPSGWIKDTRGRGIVQFDRTPLPASFPSLRLDTSLPNPKMGVSRLSFDVDATLLLVQLESQPSVIHIHTFLPSPGSSGPEVIHRASLVFNSSVKAVKWRPTAATVDNGDGSRSGAGSGENASDESRQQRLAVVTRTQALYLWDGESSWVEEGQDEDVDAGKGGIMEGVGVPSRGDFAAGDIHWAPDGLSMVVVGNKSFCVLYEEDQAGGDSSVLEGNSSRWDGGGEGLSEVLEEEEEYETWARPSGL